MLHSCIDILTCEYRTVHLIQCDGWMVLICAISEQVLVNNAHFMHIHYVFALQFAATVT